MAGTVSIALATCNGERFLPEFLNSLCAQGRLPQELVAFDDASSDNTLRILEGFSERSPFPLRIFHNTTRVGVVENFSNAISRCASEWIALADQDDFWRSNKLERLLSQAGNRTTMAAFSDAEVVDEHREPLGYTMWEQTGFDETRRRLSREDRPWEALFKDPVVTGATMVFRRQLLPLILPIPDSWMHDAWIAQIAASQGAVVPVPSPLIEYRQHGNNVIGGRRLPIVGQLRRARSIGRLGLLERELRRYGALHERLATFPATSRTQAMLALCEEKLEHLSRRRRLPATRLFRLPVVLRELSGGNYSRFAKDWRNIAADLLMR